jgi:hypothetical protein
MLLNPCSSAALQIPSSAWSNPLRSVHLAVITTSSLILVPVSRTRQLRHVGLERQLCLLSPLTRCHQISGKVSASSRTLYLPNNSHEVSTNNQNPGAINILYVPVPYRPKNAISHIHLQLLREAEAHRLEEVALRLRNQRTEAAERKKEREVKLTDRLPPTRRARTTCKRCLLLVLHD